MKHHFAPKSVFLTFQLQYTATNLSSIAKLIKRLINFVAVIINTVSAYTKIEKARLSNDMAHPISNNSIKSQAGYCSGVYLRRLPNQI